MTLKAFLAVATCFFSLVAAGLWWYSSWVKVTPDEAEKRRLERGRLTGNWGAVSISFDGTADVEHTMNAQSLWNRRAAIAAGVAAACQALYVAIAEFTPQ